MGGAYFDDTVKAVEGQVPADLVIQKEETKRLLAEKNLINAGRLNAEVDWYYGQLGIDRSYFAFNTAEEIAHHIGSLYAAKSLAHLNGNDLQLQLQNTAAGKALYVARSNPGSRDSPCREVEHTIEELYLGEGFVLASKYSVDKPTTAPHNVKCYRTQGAVSPSSDIHLRLYLVSEAHFKDPHPSPNSIAMEDITDTELWRTQDAPSRDLYLEVMKEAVAGMAPVIRLLDTEVSAEKELLIAHRSGSTHSFFSGITDLYHSFELFSSRKFVHQFSNGITFFSIFLKSRIKGAEELSSTSWREIVEAANLAYILPRTSIQSLVRDGVLTPKQYTYAYVGWKFAFHFLSRQSAEFAELAVALKNDPSRARVLDQIKKSVRKEAYTEARVMEVLLQYPHVIKELYRDFEKKHSPTDRDEAHDSKGTIALIQKSVPAEFEREVLKAFITFNDHILKTNFFVHNKIALSFRLDPSFLSKEEFPITPFGLFFLVGPEFRGFHIRFRDVARGGIRSITSNNWQAYIQNLTTVFNENYNLAATQERKNKDIAEGGSKGTILLSLDHPDKAFTAFQKYVDSLLDLLLPGNREIVYHYDQEEILFLGPDEGTANFMDWASEHARKRGYKYWKAFTTGKSLSRGGIPHDMFGMTTRSVHQYVIGALEKLGLNEDDCTKLQTGGPDGDLGSNEIKISKDKTKAIVDGSGVLYDPHGLDKETLVQLAENRQMVRKFPKEKLSPDGFYVDVEATNIKLPSGDFVENGLDFRNSFHLNALSSADIFVPCGGRPESVNLSNVHFLMDEETKKPRFKLIVEGANLFFTNDSRLFLEQQGVILFKDASANKGGVTSSSLEVLAALSMNDEEFEKHVAVKDVTPEFYTKYVAEVHKKIEENARLEFECIWREYEKSGTPRAILSDVISNKINELSLSLSSSNLWNNQTLRKRIISQACPANLLQLLGVDTILQRLPENYGRALFGCYLASRYIYTCGLSDTPEFAFFDFLQQHLA